MRVLARPYARVCPTYTQQYSTRVFVLLFIRFARAHTHGHTLRLAQYPSPWLM